MKTAKRNTETISTSFRPSLSEDGPATRAPITKPNGAALMTTPNDAGEIAHSCSTDGVTKPMMATSIPSATTIMKQSATSSH